MEIDNPYSYNSLMERAIELARKGAGFVSPNPMVGAVITKNGNIVSEAWHKKFGEHHAEIEAIKNASIDDFTDCDLIVNLEPCSHFGKNPPCVEEIIKRKFKNVIIGMTDPNPLVNGNGINKLRENGINVIQNICEEQCRSLNKVFIKNILEEKAYVIVKIAATLDGYISTGNKFQDIITCNESLKYVHQIRSEVDAIIVGSGTILNDNPLLNVRLVEGRNPKRIILDTELSLPLDKNVYLKNERELTYVIVNKNKYNKRKADILKMSEVNIIEIEPNENEKIELSDILSVLYKDHNIRSVLVEGGAKVFSSFLNSDLSDEIILFQAPLILGNGLKYYENKSNKNILSALKMNYIDFEKIGKDLKITLSKEKLL